MVEETTDDGWARLATLPLVAGCRRLASLAADRGVLSEATLSIVP
jgi:hypothetical protein